MRKIKYIVIVLLLSCLIPSNISASTQQITCSSNLYVLNGEEYHLVQKGYDFKKSENSEYLLQFVIKNEGSPVNAKIDLTGVKGLEVINDSIQINGVNTTLDQLESITLSDTTLIELNVRYISGSNEVASKIRVYLLEHEQTHSFAFSYTINTQSTANSLYTVRFYGIANELVETQQVRHNESATIPSYNYIGYKVTGYNTKKNGEGTYYNNEAIQSNQSFYLIYEPLQYSVNYHVDDSIYETLKVYFGEEIKQIEAPQKEGYKFIMWLGASGPVSGNVDLYAVYQNIQTNEYIISNNMTSSELQVIINKIKEETGQHQQNQYREIDDGSEYYAYVDENGSLAFIAIDTTQENQINYGLVIVTLLGIMGIIFSIYKQRKQKTQGG